MVDDAKTEEFVLSFKAAGEGGETVSLPLKADGSRLARLRDIFKNADGSRIAKALDIFTTVMGTIDKLSPVPQAFTAPDGGSPAVDRDREIILNQIDHHLGCLQAHMAVPEARALPLEKLEAIRDLFGDTVSEFGKFR